MYLMSEIADDMIGGFSCSWCGIYFEESHGYPVICRGCYRDWQKENNSKGKRELLRMCGVQLANEKELCEGEKWIWKW